MSIDILMKQLKSKKLNNLYLFYGPEAFMKKYYTDSVVEHQVKSGSEEFNKVILEGKVDAGRIIEACHTMPFFSDGKVVIVRNSGLFKNKNSEEDTLISFLKNIPDFTVLLFVEDEVDKRLKTFKTTKEIGLIVEFDFQKPAELTKWVVKVFRKSNKAIDTKCASRIVEYCEPNMTEILNEIDKVIMYMGDETNVKTEHIEAVVVKSIKTIIFDLMDAIFEKKSSKAISLLHDMLYLKEPHVRIVFMIARQIRQVLELKALLEMGIPTGQAGSKLKVAPFILKKLTRQVKNYDIETLKNAMIECLKLDTDIKTGQIDPQTGIELFIIKYSTI